MSGEHKLQLRTVRHLWGVEEAWETVIPKIKKNGYYAIETPPHIFPEEDRKRLKNLLQQNDLKFISQFHTDSYEPGKRSKDVQHHIDNFRKQMEIAKDMGAIYCNSHSGYDGWSTKERDHFFTEALQIEKHFGLTVAHETHRRRIFYNPWDTRDILQKFPDVKVTADLSHWFCVLSDKLDGEMDIINLTAQHTIYIHARVGYDNGPQVNDPRDPANLHWVEAHERCWDLMWKAQAEKKLEYTYLCPEFGPPTYMHVQPYTQMPVVNLWDICEWTAHREVARFNRYTDKEE